MFNELTLNALDDVDGVGIVGMYSHMLASILLREFLLFPLHSSVFMLAAEL